MKRQNNMLPNTTLCRCIGVGDEHHLIFRPVGGGEQPFERAVARHLRRAHRRAADDKTVGQPRAHRLGDVGHRLAIGYAAMIAPVPALLGAPLRRLCVDPGLPEPAPDRVALHPAEVYAGAAAPRSGGALYVVVIARSLRITLPNMGGGG